MQSVLLPPPFSGCIRFLKPATGLQRCERGENIVMRRLGLTKKTKKQQQKKMLPAACLVCFRSACRKCFLFFFVLTLLLSSSACALVLIVNSLHLTPQRIFYCWLFCTMVLHQRGMNWFCSVLPTYYNLKRIFYPGLFIFTHSAVVNSCRSHLLEFFQQYGF